MGSNDLDPGAVDDIGDPQDNNIYRMSTGYKLKRDSSANLPDFRGESSSRESNLSRLRDLASQLVQDLDLVEVEKLELEVKCALRDLVKGGIDGKTARSIAEFQRDVGFIRKYKSYAVKCASPLGYSIFYQNPHEGFSFQRHRVHKTEIFHILKVHEGGFVFLCDYEDWERYYDPERFQRWLAGEPTAVYDQFCFRPHVGDVFSIDQLGTVHTVFGCELEEFANDSTDLVDRLHDQNMGKPIPASFNRRFTEAKIRETRLPESARFVDINPGGFVVRDIPPIKINGGYKTVYGGTSFTAAKYAIGGKQSTELFYDEENTASLFFPKGGARLLIEDKEKLNGAAPHIQVRAGDLFLIPAGVRWRIANDLYEVLHVSEHKLPLDMAFSQAEL